MKHGFMPDHVFNVGAVVIAKMHFELGRPIEDSAASLGDNYRRGYGDDGFEESWKVVARALIDSNAANANRSNDFLQLLYFVSEFDGQSTKRRRRLFRGAAFNRQQKPVSDRVARFAATYANFLTLLACGKAPIPPKGWVFQ